MSLKKIDGLLVLAIAGSVFLGYTVYSDRRPRPMDPQLKKGWIEVGHLLDKLKLVDKVPDLERRLFNAELFIAKKDKNFMLPRPR